MWSPRKRRSIPGSWWFSGASRRLIVPSPVNRRRRLMPSVLVSALVVIGQHLDDAALPYRAVVAVRQHAREFAAQPGQLFDALVDLGQMLLDDGVYPLTRRVLADGERQHRL